MGRIFAERIRMNPLDPRHPRSVALPTGKLPDPDYSVRAFCFRALQRCVIENSSANAATAITICRICYPGIFYEQASYGL